MSTVILFCRNCGLRCEIWEQFPEKCCDHQEVYAAGAVAAPKPDAGPRLCCVWDGLEIREDTGEVIYQRYCDCICHYRDEDDL